MENEAEDLKQLPAPEDKAYQGKGKEFGINRGSGNGDAREAGARGADAREAGARGADAREAGARGADARGADARGADAREAGARGADARGAGARGTGARGTGARGTGARGTGARGTGARGTGARGTGARGTGARGTGARGTGARGTGARGAGARGAGARGAGARGAGARGAGARGAGARGAGACGAGARGAGACGAGARGVGARGAGARRILGTRRREDGLFEPLLLPIKHISVNNMCYPTLCRELLVKNRTLFTPRADDVIVTTYPRSGTTWTLEITRQIHLAQLTPLPAQHPLKTQDHMISAAPWINNYNNMVHRNLDSDPSPRVMKSHNHYCHVNLLPSNTDTKLIHVMRNPKDVLCSAYHNTLLVGLLLDYQGRYAEFVQFFLAGKVESGSYWDFNRDYLNNVNKHNILYLTYEELSSDKRGCIIGQINSFLGYSTLSTEQMDKIDKMTRFEVMKRTQRPLQGNVQGTTGQSKGMLSERERQDVNVKTWIEFQDVADQIPTSYYQNIVN